MITLNIQGVDVPCLLDSGSQVTSISAEFFEQNLQNFVESPRPCDCLKVIASNGLPVPYDGFVVADVTFKDHIVQDRGILIASRPREIPGLVGTNIIDHIPVFAQGRLLTI